MTLTVRRIGPFGALRRRLMTWSTRDYMREPARIVRGVSIYIADETSGNSAMLDRLDEALTLLGDTDPQQFRQLLRKRCPILVLDGAYGHYSPDTNVITLGPKLLFEGSVESVAVAIVHEITHARIARWIPFSGLYKTRIERACLRQELTFLERLARAGRTSSIVALLSRWRSAYESPLPTAAQLLERMDAVMEGQKVPQWMRHVTFAIARVAALMR